MKKFVCTVWKEHRKLSICLGLSVIVICLYIFHMPYPLMECQGKCKVLYSVLECLNAMAISYVVAFLVFVLTVELPIQKRKSEQGYLRKDMLSDLNSSISDLLISVGFDKAFSLESLKVRMMEEKSGNIKLSEWGILNNAMEKIASKILDIITCGLTLDNDEHLLLSKIYNAVSATKQWANEDFNDAKWRLLMDIINNLNQYHEELDVLSAPNQ